MKTIFRTKKGKNADTYTRVSNGIFKYKLSCEATYVLINALTKPDYWKFHLNVFSKEINMGEKRVRSAINELVVNGFCHKMTINKRQVDYFFFESPSLNFFNNTKQTNQIDLVSQSNGNLDTVDLQF